MLKRITEGRNASACIEKVDREKKVNEWTRGGSSPCSPLSSFCSLYSTPALPCPGATRTWPSLRLFICSSCLLFLSLFLPVLPFLLYSTLLSTRLIFRYISTHQWREGEEYRGEGRRREVKRRESKVCEDVQIFKLSTCRPVGQCILSFTSRVCERSVRWLTACYLHLSICKDFSPAAFFSLTSSCFVSTHLTLSFSLLISLVGNWTSISFPFLPLNSFYLSVQYRSSINIPLVFSPLLPCPFNSLFINFHFPSCLVIMLLLFFHLPTCTPVPLYTHSISF